MEKARKKWMEKKKRDEKQIEIEEEQVGDDEVLMKMRKAMKTWTQRLMTLLVSFSR